MTRQILPHCVARRCADETALTGKRLFRPYSCLIRRVQAFGPTPGTFLHLVLSKGSCMGNGSISSGSGLRVTADASFRDRIASSSAVKPLSEASTGPASIPGPRRVRASDTGALALREAEA